MKHKEKYYKLDEIGFVGMQEKESAFKKKLTTKRTGEVFRAARKVTARKTRRKAL